MIFARRGCDIEGTWRPASVTGLEAHAEALGMTGAMKEQYIQSKIIRQKTLDPHLYYVKMR